MSRGVVTASVQYLKRLPLYSREKPFQLFVPVDADATDKRYTNLEFESRDQSFTDIRDRAADFSLDEHGFEVKRWPTALDAGAFADREVVESRYFSEMEELLKTLEGGCDRAYFFDWRLRSADSHMTNDTMFDMNDFTTWLRPSPHVHVDQSPWAVLNRVQLHFGDEAASLLEGRVRVINIWRPVDHPVEDYPLAVCDGTTILDEDLTQCDHVRRKFKGENLYAHSNTGHQWYYLGEQTRDEVLLMKMFDSDPLVKAYRCPHASFHHPAATANAKPRKSIEVRALVFNCASSSDVP